MDEFNDTKMLLKDCLDRIAILEKELEQLKQQNPLYGKTIYYLGSSWTYGLGCDGTDNFAMRIAARNSMHFVNESVSKTTYVLRDGRHDSYYERADLLPAEKPDYVLLQMSSNDARHSDLPVGHVTDFYEEDPLQGRRFDLYTVAGAMEGTISKLMVRWPGTKFVWYTGFRGPVYGSPEVAERTWAIYRVLVDEIAPKWGTPVCDLSLRAGLNTFVKGNRDLLTWGDGQHCIKEGYDCWEPVIEAFLKTL